MQRFPLALAAASALFLLMTSCSIRKTCDLLIVNARIHTLDADNNLAGAMAIRDGRVVATGDAAEMRERFLASVTLDLGGRDVFPGFIDAHAHLYGIGDMDAMLALHGLHKHDVLARVAGAAGLPSTPGWIRGRGWDQNIWTPRVFPTRRELDSVADGRPVFLSRVDGHAAWVSSAALRIAGVDRNTPDPAGGRIERDARGEPTGILLDNAVELVRTHIPPPTLDERRRTYQAAVQRCLRAGLTGMHDMGMTAENVTALRNLIEAGGFPFRVVAYIDGTGDAWEDLLRRGRTVYGDKQLVLAGLKLYADGALGSRGALLLDDYADAPGTRGIPIAPADTIEAETRRAVMRGLQVCVHAIGDAANRLTLDAYQRALASSPRPTAPLRVEHVQVLAPADAPRFAALGVVPSMQPVHCTSDMRWAEARLGARRVRSAYAWRALLSTGVHIAAGSDAPVERPEPLEGMYAAIFRRDAEGRPASQQDIDSLFQTDPAAAGQRERWNEGWYGGQRMTPLEAVRAFTTWAAAAAGMESLLGSLESGKFADFVVLSGDPLTSNPRQFRAIRVLKTFHGGKEVFGAR